MMVERDKYHTKTKEELSIENILHLKKIIIEELDNLKKGVISKEEYSEIILHHFLIFTLGGCEEKVLYKYAWDYFDKNKKYLINQIP